MFKTYIKPFLKAGNSKQKANMLIYSSIISLRFANTKV